jgi:hypothetical protein
MRPTDYELQPAPEFLFDPWPDHRSLARNHPLVATAVLVLGTQPLHRAGRHDHHVISRHSASTLTVTSDPANQIVIAGGDWTDWSVFFYALGTGNTVSEAEEHLRQRSCHIGDATVSLGGPSLYEGNHGQGDLVIEAPRDAGAVIHASYAATQVRDIAGAVRIAASHARASILDTTGQLDVTAGVVDFAGSSGRVTLSAEMDANLKMTRREFRGVLLAWAQHSVRMLVPRGFATPIEVTVKSRDRFVCRTDFLSNLRHRKNGDLHVFNYGDDSPDSGLHLRSEQSTVVIDQVVGKA